MGREALGGLGLMGFVGESGAGGEFVEADGSGLAEVHGGLARVGGDFDEVMAEGEVFSGEAVFFGAEDDGDSSVVVEFAGDDGSELIEADDGLFRFAVGECAGAENEGGVADGFGEGGGFTRVGEEFGSADGGAGFAPVGLVRRDDGEVRETEVSHGTGDCADVERVARGDEDDGDAIALVLREQGMIVEPGI